MNGLRMRVLLSYKLCASWAYRCIQNNNDFRCWLNNNLNFDLELRVKGVCAAYTYLFIYKLFPLYTHDHPQEQLPQAAVVVQGNQGNMYSLA